MKLVSSLRQWKLLAVVIWRPALIMAAAEIPLMAAVAATVVFFGAITIKPPVDGALFFARSSFDRVAVVDSRTPMPGVISADVLPRFPVVRDRASGESLAYTPELQTVEVDVVDRLSDFAPRVLGANVESYAGGPGALVDEDTARRLGVRAGDAVALDLAAIGGNDSVRVTMVGMLRPYTSPRGRGETGLIVVDRSLLPEDFLTDVATLLPSSDEPFTRIYDAEPGAQAGSMTRMDLVQVFVGQLFGRDAILVVLGLTLSGGLLWLMAVWRGVGHFVRRSSATAAVLVALGGNPRTVRWAVLAPEMGVIVAAQTMGAAIVAALMFPDVLGSTLQPWALVPIFGLLSICSAVVLALAFAGVHDSLETEAILSSLVMGDE